jgi:peptidoglycan LD-endopeptidase LytH
VVIKVIPPERKSDRWGAGHWHARRGERKHEGIDYDCSPGSVVLSSVDGIITKLGWPYSQRNRQHLRYIQVTTDEGHHHRYFYVKPIVQQHGRVKVGDAIGIVQTLQDIWPGITDHVHYEIIVEGDKVNPTNYLFKWSD